MEVINWLNSNSGAIIALATIVLVIVTGSYVRLTKNYVHLTEDYVRLTRELLEENRQMRLDAQKPEINVELYSHMEKGQIHVDLCVENLGGGPAYDLEFTADLSYKLSDRRTLNEVIFLDTGIRRLAQGRKKTHRLGAGSQLRVGELRDKPLEIGVVYRNRMGKEETEDFFLDFREHFGR